MEFEVFEVFLFPRMKQAFRRSHILGQEERVISTIFNEAERLSE